MAIEALIGFSDEELKCQDRSGASIRCWLKPCPTPPAQAVFKDLAKTALDRISAKQTGLGDVVDGWQITNGVGRYGTDYMKRALVAAFGWPANLQNGDGSCEATIYLSACWTSPGRSAPYEFERDTLLMIGDVARKAVVRQPRALALLALKK